MNNLQLVKHGVGVLAAAYRQLSFTKKFFKPLVQEHCVRLGYTLSKSERKKVLFYYPLYTILANAEMFLAVKGRGLTVEERKRLTIVGAMATLCDDLIDEHDWPRDRILDLLANQFNEDGLETKAQLLVALNKELNALWPLPEKYLTQLRVALEWQSCSAQQLDPTITPGEIAHISREKNGHTNLMFATLIDEDWTDAEKKFIHQVGIVGQLTNDSFDIYFDTRDGINTAINRAPSIAAARGFFIEENKKLNKAVMDCEGLYKFKKYCIHRMSCMHGFGLVALDYLQQTENKYGLPIDWTKPARKEMVTDMAMLKNRMKLPAAVKYLSRL